MLWRNDMKKIVKYILLASMALTLVACGKKKDVVYVDDNIQNVDTYTNSDAIQARSVREELGLGDEKKWKEDVVVNNKNYKIDAQISVPEVEYMESVEASEYYLTNEDKKKILNVFMDADSIQVDPENPAYPTKENIEELIKYKETKLELYPANCSIYKKAEAEIAELNEMLDVAPVASDVDKNPGDYSAPCFEGTKNGIQYTSRFVANPTKKQSYYNITAKNLKEFNNSGSIYLGTTPYPDKQNLCSMTEQQAIDKAEKLLGELGITHMTPIYTTTLC